MITEHLLSDPRPLTTIIFDADGTLIDGEPADFEARTGEQAHPLI